MITCNKSRMMVINENFEWRYPPQVDSVPLRRHQLSNENRTVRCRTLASELFVRKAMGASKIIMKKILFTMFIVSNQNLILRPQWDIIHFDHKTQRNETGTGKDVSSFHSTRYCSAGCWRKTLSPVLWGWRSCRIKWHARKMHTQVQMQY